MSLIASICVLVVAAHVLGWLAERCGQLALLGQMVAGLLVGPSLFGWLKPSPSLAAISDVSVLFVIITAGLEMRMQDVLTALRGRGALALMLGFLIPAAAAAVFGYGLGLSFTSATVLVLCVATTALPVALRILSSLDLLNTRVARVAIASSLLADVIILLSLGVLIAVSRPQQAGGSLPATVGIALLKLVLLLVVVGACHYACSRISTRKGSTADAGAPPPAEAGSPVDNILIVAVMFMVGLGVISEALGFHFAIGVFLASLLVTSDLIQHARFRNLERTFELMTVSLFGPLFLAYQGVQFEVGLLKDVGPILGLIAIAVSSKLMGGYAAARLAFLPHYEACGVAIVLNARGVMEMVIASIAYRAGLVSQELFSMLLIVGIATTMITPSLLKYWMKDTTKMQAMLRAGESSAA
jgi:Kef-type K+ transport system membrane component KefB